MQRSEPEEDNQPSEQVPDENRGIQTQPEPRKSEPLALMTSLGSVIATAEGRSRVASMSTMDDGYYVYLHSSLWRILSGTKRCHPPLDESFQD